MSSAKQSFDENAISTVAKEYTAGVPTGATDDGVGSSSKESTQGGDDAKSTRNASPFEVPAGQAGVGAVARKLSSRHIQMIGIGGGIGTGLFVGSGIALANAGPVGVLLAYVITGMTIFGVMEGLAEMASFLPVSGSFMHFATRFVDPSLGMALGWNYWWCYAIGWASELSAASAVIQYWNADINIAVWISIMPKSKKYGASMNRVLVLRWIGAKQKTAGSGGSSHADHEGSKSNVIYLNWKTIPRIPRV